VDNDATIEPSLSGSDRDAQTSGSSEEDLDFDRRLAALDEISLDEHEQDSNSQVSEHSAKSTDRGQREGLCKEECDTDDGSQSLSDEECADSDISNEDFKDEFLEHGYDPDEDIDYPKTMDDIIAELEGMMGPEDDIAMYDIREQ
jgi:hypothetical protein